MAKRPTRKTPDAPSDRGKSPAARLADFMAAQLAASRASAAVDEAQEIMFDAFECDDPKRRVALARKALKVSADCADAYVLLAAEDARSAAEELALLAEGVAAGERALGQAAFEEDVGHFWGLLETRPYMRARHALAAALWEAGRRDEAVGNAEEMLRLNPNDNQGVRNVLVTWLLALGRDAACKGLIAAYRDDGGAWWAWSRALAAFRKGGDTAAARKALAAAMANNRHVLRLLTSARKPPAPPPYYSPGERSEAICYALEAREAWAATPEALAWLKGRAAEG